MSILRIYGYLQTAEQTSYEAFALALIKVADTVKEATDKFEPSKKKRKREEKGDD